VTNARVYVYISLKKNFSVSICQFFEIVLDNPRSFKLEDADFLIASQEIPSFPDILSEAKTYIDA